MLLSEEGPNFFFSDVCHRFGVSFIPFTINGALILIFTSPKCLITIQLSLFSLLSQLYFILNGMHCVVCTNVHRTMNLVRFTNELFAHMPSHENCVNL